MELILFCGIQCAGKSTFYERKFSSTHARINLDTQKTRKNEMAEFMLLIERRFPVVVDNTNTEYANREIYIEIAKARGYRVVGYQFDVTLAIALHRSSKRNRQKVVPDFVVRNTLKKMQPLSLSEGFDRILIVDSNGKVVSDIGGS